MISLVVAVLGLVVGPVLSSLSPSSRIWREAIGGLSLTLVAGLCLLYLAPHALEHGGLLALGAILVGAMLPALTHRAGDRNATVWYSIALALLTVHAATDGALLALADGDLGVTVAIAIAAHRLPVGLAVFDVARDTPRKAWMAIGLLALATVFGFGAGASLADALPETLHGAFEGLVAGALLHTVVLRHPAPDDHDHHHHAHDHDHDHAHRDHGQPRPGAAEPVGALVGIALLGAFTHFAGGYALHHEETARTFVALTLDSAPALLLGFVLAGLVSSFLDPAGATWLARGGRFGQALRGVSFGLPLPVCSCGVVPMYASLVKTGVPTAAALAFLVATPELGLDAVLLSVPLLGVQMTVARVGAAFAAALLVAVLVGQTTAGTSVATSVTSAATPAPPRPTAERLREGLSYGLVDLVDHTLPWVVVGLMLAALAQPLLDQDLLLTMPTMLQVPLAAVVGVPLYVCASGATPLAAIAVHKGLSAGATLAFLIAGPATNVTTFGVLASLHGRGLAIRFGVAMVAIAIGIGWMVDLIGVASPDLLPAPGAEHQAARPIAWASTAVLTALALGSLFRQGMHGLVGQITDPIHVH